MAKLRINMRFVERLFSRWCLITIGTLLIANSIAGTACAFQAEDLSSDFRSWTNNTGKFSVEARLLLVKDNLAKLEKKDGRILDLPLNKLSKKDNTFIETLREKANDPANPFTSGKESNPFAGGSARGKDSPSSISRAPNRSNAGGRRKLSFGNQAKSGSDSKTINVQTVFADVVLADEGWRVEIDGAGPDQSRERFKKAVELPSVGEKYSAHDNRTRPKIDHTGSIAAISVSNPFEKKTGFGVVDLTNGDSLGAALLSIEDVDVFAVDSDNRQILTIEEGSGRDGDKIAFRSFDDLETPIKFWELGGFAQKNGFEPELGFFVGSNRMLTLGDNLVLWDVEKAEPVYAVELESNARTKPAAVAFSPNKKTVAIIQDNSVQLIDVATGNLRGVIPASKTLRSVCISPSGEYLAGLESSGQVWVWDLAANEMAQEFKSNARRKLEWVDDGNLLGDGKLLLDVEYRVCVWEYESEHDAELIRLGDGDFLLQSDNYLLVVKLPHKDLSTKLQDLDPEDLVLIRPGDEFAIDFDLPFDDTEQQEIRESLEQRMGEMGYSINEQASLKLRGRVKKEKSLQSKVRSFHGNTEIATINYAPHRSTIEIIDDGKVIWSTSRYHAPSYHIQTEEDETLQQYADRVSKPNSSLFLNFKIPTNLSTLPDGKPLGKVNLKAARIR